MPAPRSAAAADRSLAPQGEAAADRMPAPRAAAAAGRTRAVERLLRDSGISAVRVTADGHESEIAAIAAVPDAWSRIRELAPKIKACGFRYVALDLDPDPTGPTRAHSVPTGN